MGAGQVSPPSPLCNRCSLNTNRENKGWVDDRTNLVVSSSPGFQWLLNAGDTLSTLFSWPCSVSAWCGIPTCPTLNLAQLWSPFLPPHEPHTMSFQHGDHSWSSFLPPSPNISEPDLADHPLNTWLLFPPPSYHYSVVLANSVSPLYMWTPGVVRVCLEQAGECGWEKAGPYHRFRMADISIFQPFCASGTHTHILPAWHSFPLTTPTFPLLSAQTQSSLGMPACPQVLWAPIIPVFPLPASVSHTWFCITVMAELCLPKCICWCPNP